MSRYYDRMVQVTIIVLLSFTLLFLFFFQHFHNVIEVDVSDRSFSLKQESVRNKTITIVLLSCLPRNTTVAKWILLQTKVFIKSLVITSSRKINVIILSDDTRVFGSVKDYIMKSWPPSFRKLINLSHRAVDNSPQFGIDAGEKSCTGQKMVLPELLRDKDAVIMVDIDTVFIRPVEELWDLFDNFEERHVIAAPPLMFYRLNRIYPFIQGEINTGVIMYNLTRARKLPETWSGLMLDMLNLCSQYIDEVSCHDHQIYNLMINIYRDMIYFLPCEWNFRKFMCSWNRCDSASNHGIGIIHATGNQFVDRDWIGMLTLVHKFYNNYNLSSTEHPQFQFEHYFEYNLDLVRYNTTKKDSYYIPYEVYNKTLYGGCFNEYFRQIMSKGLHRIQQKQIYNFTSS